MSNKPKIVPELFPVVINGETQWVKRGVYAKQIAGQQQISLKADIRQSHVVEMIEGIEKGTKEMNPEAPDEIKATFEIVQQAYEEAVQHVIDVAREEEETKAREEQEKKDKEAAEDKIVLSVKDNAADFGTLAKLFDTGENMDRFIPKAKMSDETLLGAFSASLKMGEFTNWMKGDLVVALEDRGQLGVVSKLCEATGQPYANVYNAGKTARNVPPDKRTKGVSYTIYAEIANARYSDKEDEHNKTMIELVEKAASGEIKSSQEAREIKNKAAGKKPAPKKLPEDDEKHLFIVIDHAQELVQVTAGFPKELFAEGSLVIDKSNGKIFQSFKSKPENRWADLPIYAKPKPPEPKPATPAKKSKGKK